MNLYFRLLWMFLTARFKPAVSVLEPLETHHRVWPNDLDVFGHVNNGRYFTLTDIVRMEWLVRAGLWKKMKPLGIYPVMAGETAQFRGSLLPFQKYSIVTRMMGWDERFTYIEHQFKAQGKVAALIIVKSRMLTKSGDRVSPQQMLELAEIGHLDTIKMDEVLETWNNSTLSHWDQVS